MIKKTLAVALTALLAMNAYAKVTFETAIEEDRAARANNVAVDMGALVGGISQTALESSSGNNWINYWNGSTTGSVSIPSHAKDVFIISNAGMFTFPKNVGARNLASASVSNFNTNNKGSVYLHYNGHAISGGSKTIEWYENCSSGSQNNNSQCKRSKTVTITVNKVMYK